MFTGLVEEVGTIEDLRSGPASAELVIRASRVLEDAHIGDSIAVNGVCLTVTSLPPGHFTAHAMHETLNRSALGTLKRGSCVNLERTMRADGRFGGHIVAGHIDATGTILSIRRDATAVWFTIQAPPSVLRYVVEKGSIAVDGISLTVARVSSDTFSFSAIPHTVRQTVLRERREGDPVNLETDLIGKYVEKLLQPAPAEPKRGITAAFLAEHGFQ